MNRIIATTGALALGAVALQPAAAQDGKPWSVSATVRSFYDDNWTTAPSRPAPGGSSKRSTWGVELSPSGAYRLSLDQTSLDLNARYGMRYFEDRTSGSADHSFDFGADLTHRFSEKQQVSVTESFAIAQEPGVLDQGPVATSLRSQGNNLRNSLQLKYSWDDIIERWSGEVSYAGTLFDYEETGAGRKSALLDRNEHLFTLAGRYRFFDETATDGLVGYSLGLTDQTSKESLLAPPSPFISPAARDSRSHYFFTGVNHKFTPTLKASARIGVLHVEYPNAASADAALATIPAPPFQRSQTSPYFDGSGTWEYGPNSTVQLGVRHTRISTDVATSADAEATTVYSSLNHEFYPELRGSLLVQYQQSQYRQSVGAQDAADGIFGAGLNLEWRFHQFISLEGGYNYDRVDSDIGGRSYYRNRIYFGFKGTW